MPSQRARHYNGTTAADATPGEVALVARGVGLLVANRDGTNLLEFSLDLGKTFFPVPALLPPVKVECLFEQLWVRCPTSHAVAYSVIVLEG